MSEQLTRQEVLDQRRSHWKQHIEQWRSSEMTQKAYCQQHDIGYHQFSYWKKRFVQTETGITFVPLKIPRSLPLPPAMKTSPLRIIVNSVVVGRGYSLAATIREAQRALSVVARWF